MPRKKKPVETVTVTHAEPVNMTPVMAEPAAVEPRNAEPQTTVEEQHAQPPTEQNGQKTWAPRGPHWFKNEPLSESNTGPRMRLGRDNRFNQMTMSFDEKPCEEVRERLNAAHWKWRPAESQWTKQLDLEHRARGHQDAEKLFEELAKIERRERQLDEVTAAIRR